MSLFKNFLEITLAVIEVEIKHLSIYLKRPAQATFIHVNTVLQPRVHASLGFSGTLLVGIPFGYYLFFSSTYGTRKASLGVARGLSTMDRARRAPFASALLVLWRLPRTELQT